VELGNISHASDTTLVEAAQQGDVASFGQLYQRHYRMAVGIARSRVTDIHLAEDIAQEAFATACRTLSTLRDGSRFPQWLGTICRRTASQIANSRPRLEPLASDHEQPDTTDSGSLQHETAEALQMLDETAREIVLLHYFGGLTHLEIATVFCLTPQAVHGRLQRARARLAVILSADDETSETPLETKELRTPR
jgi:RNA polymerase sigma-70 factor (ECF subfamily)